MDALNGKSFPLMKPAIIITIAAAAIGWLLALIQQP
jgi:hypothetical protein